MNNWISALFNNIGNMRRPMMNMFGVKRKSNWGWLWGSLISIVLSTAAVAFTRSRNHNANMHPMQQIMSKSNMNNAFKNQNLSALTEMADELGFEKKKQ
ncbi:hypothetical protein ACOSZF_06690 [Cytobacillus firmus]|uniref:Uncharacterized protein n=1 Tax=Cytobacillus firmus TaxID=1399 RepID=A0A380XTZ2_CYTFI|nr:hypothetical protein [Cytobacillus firmus]KAF0821815.1 hypothetical protein KIS1582_4437 [Cytobacillus firmus]MBG9543290.1 hypothetical protein [Cytobacillus firmus]MBG9550543.1 hypothetical protein [Cytobacillus firmus]MBG9553939.1 hypothetical protein [Cytobacillus firmus]MBG9558650.1 hypothetical protein [Cytobacillus firmus]